jgi:hypothetical protein
MSRNITTNKTKKVPAHGAHMLVKEVGINYNSEVGWFQMVTSARQTTEPVKSYKVTELGNRRRGLQIGQGSLC